MQSAKLMDLVNRNGKAPGGYCTYLNKYSAPYIFSNFNGTSGDIQIAIDAISAASWPHHFMSVTEQGLAAIVQTRGNRDTHVILRGGRTGPNFDAASVAVADKTDGGHLDAANTRKIGEGLVPVVKKILGL